MSAPKSRSRDGYETSRVMYIIEALFEYFISILTSGAYLAKLTTTIGISDSMTAILSAITSLTGLFQIFSIYLAHRTPVKRWIIPSQIVSQVMFAMLYLIPIFGVGKNTGLLFFAVIVFANAIKSVCSPPKVNWFMSLVEPQKRGSYSSILTIVSVIGSTIFTLIMGNVIDRFEAVGDTQSMFITITVLIFILVVLNVTPLFIAKERVTDIEKSSSALESVSDLMKNKKYRITLICLTLYSISSGLCVPFLGTYQIGELGFSMTFIAALDTVINIIWIAGLATAGRISKKVPYRAILRFAFATSVLIYTPLIFTNPSSGAVLFPVYRLFAVLYSSAQAVSQSNHVFDITEPWQRVSALALITISTGVCSFMTTLAVTPIVNYIQANPIEAFGIEIYAQQVLAVISLIATIVLNVIWNLSYKTISGETQS